MRIIGGSRRGLRLAEVGEGDPAAHLRPTSDRVREAIFNLLINAHGDPVTGARVLDLFAGTGALGLEALSRGAAEVVFVDNGAKAATLIRDNVARMQAGAETRILRLNATKLGLNPTAPYSLIFLDPPYGKSLGEAAVTSALNGGWIADDAMIVWEEATAPATPEGTTVLDRRRYGDTTVTLLAQA